MVTLFFTDVVGVEGQAWTHPPFAAVEEGGMLHGRRALDMKVGTPIPYLFNESPDGLLLEAAGMQDYDLLRMYLPPEIDLPSRIHGADERAPLAAIDFRARALLELLRQY